MSRLFMQTAILILLAAVVLILLWLVIQSQKKTADPSIGLMQQEVQQMSLSALTAAEVFT